MLIYYYRKNKVKKYVKLENVNLIIGIIILAITLILYYINSNIYIKVLNLIMVCIYAFLENKDMIINMVKLVLKNKRRES